jgi:hypothetical protein
MSDVSALSPILTSAVGLMGAMVAGLSVYLTYKSRHNLLRQLVYGRQMDAYFNITESMSALYTATHSALAVRNPYLKGEDAAAKFRSALREEHERFTGTVNRSLIVLPSKVKAAVDEFNETVLAIGEPEEGRVPAKSDPAAGPKDPAQELSKAYERALNSIRIHLAIDSLTTGMLKEMGVGSESVTVKSFRHRVNPLVPVGRGAR